MTCPRALAELIARLLFKDKVIGSVHLLIMHQRPESSARSTAAMIYKILRRWRGESSLCRVRRLKCTHLFDLCLRTICARFAYTLRTSWLWCFVHTDCRYAHHLLFFFLSFFLHVCLYFFRIFQCCCFLVLSLCLLFTSFFRFLFSMFF